jgi:ABC-2 type transport system ATP-binding protein
MHVIEATAVAKRYGMTVAVDGVDLRVGRGEVVALLGPNGAGKSTLVDVVLGLIRPDAGTVRLCGRSPVDACRAGYVGAMLQHGGLLGGLTVRELVEVVRGLSPRPLPLGDVLEAAGATELADRRADRLSGGQVQRVRFALAIAGDPELLVLDEPTAAFDVSARRSFWSTIQRWTARGRTVLFATHHLEEADAYADRVVLLAHGRVAACGPPAAISAIADVRSIRAVVPGGATRALEALPGVRQITRRGDAVTLRCTDPDAALRALLARWPGAHHVEVSGPRLEDAVVALTDQEVAL